MSNALEINGRELQPIKDVVSAVAYSKDYITRLARERKITATNTGRQWYVDLDSLKKYEEASIIEQDLRKKRLSEERKLEQKTKISIQKKEVLRNERARTLKVKAVVATSLVLGLGIFSGWVTHSILFIDESSQGQLANTAEPFSSGDVQNETPLSISEQNPPSSNIRPISDSVEEGVLLLPYGASHASATEMFSDEVIVLTAPDGTQAVVRVNEEGVPEGEVIPFVTVPVNNRVNI